MINALGFSVRSDPVGLVRENAAADKEVSQ